MVRHLEPGRILVGAHLEPQRDNAYAVTTLAAHPDQSFERFKLLLLLVDDFPFYLEGTGAGPDGSHRYFRLVHIRG